MFNFYKFLYPAGRILDIYYKNRGSIEGSLEKPLNTIKESTANLLKVSNSFKFQLQTLVGPMEIPEGNLKFQERFIKAVTYFKEQTKATIEVSIKGLSFSTDNKAIQKDIEKQLDTLEELLETKLFFFEGLKDGFKTDEFLALRAKSVFLGKEQPKKQRKTVIDGTTNIELFELLRELRNQIANREDLVHFQIFTQKSLYAMCELLPTSKQELKTIHGMGKTRIEKYAMEILQVIKRYCKENAIETSNTMTFFEELKPKKQKGDTKKISLELFKAGKSIEQIALERELNSNTIFGHLADFISSGEVKITDLISKANYSELKKIIPTKSFENLSDLKHQLDDRYSYGEIRLTLQDLSN